LQQQRADKIEAACTAVISDQSQSPDNRLKAYVSRSDFSRAGPDSMRPRPMRTPPFNSMPSPFRHCWHADMPGSEPAILIPRWPTSTARSNSNQKTSRLRHARRLEE